MNCSCPRTTLAAGGAGVVISLFCMTAWAAPVDVPLHHWSYEAIERLAARGLCSRSGLGMKPWTRDQISERISEALKALEKNELEVSSEVAYQIEEELLRLSYEFTPELETSEARARETEEARQPGQPFRWRGFFFQTALVGEKFGARLERDSSNSLIENSQGLRLEDGFNGRWHLPSWVGFKDRFAVTVDPGLRTAKRNSDTDFDVEEASAKMVYRNFELKGGALNFWWGPGYHGELLLTNNTRPLRAFSLRTRRPFHLPWKFDRLGEWQAQLIGARLEEKRTIPEPFLAGTRLEWVPGRRFVFGASHTTLFGGSGEEEGIAEFFNALDPTQGGGQEERADHLFGGDVRVFLPEVLRWLKLGSGFEGYGEFFGEDTKGFYLPEFVSYLGGFFITDLGWPGLDFRFEAAKTDRIAYEHFVYKSGYRFKNEFIGHAVGEDADDLFFRLTQKFSVEEKPFVVGLQVDRERRGLSGEALSFGQSSQKKFEVQLDIAHEFSKQVEVTAAYQFEDVNDFQGSSGINSQNHIVSLTTLFRF